MERASLPSTGLLADPEFRRLSEAAAISFDFFDTLFTRPLAHPEDAFDILGERFAIADFRARRRQAQVEAFRRMHQARRKEISLADIYNCFRLEAGSATTTAELMQAEYALELALIEPIADMLELLRTLIAAGKPVVITSDMYLTVDFFREALAPHGLDHLPLYVSASCNATKRDSGELFEQVAADLGLPPAQLLHIGDNALADVQRPREKGWQAYHYQPPTLTTAARPAKESVLATSLGYGLMQTRAPELGTDPYAELGFVYGGPATVGFLDWIRERAAADRIDHLLFLSRDGYALERLARTELGQGLPHSTYFLGSRTAFTLAAMTADNFDQFIPFLLSGADGLAPHEVLDRVGVPAPTPEVMAELGLSDDIHTDPARHHAHLASFLHAWRWEILKVCRRNRRALYQYLQQIGLRSGQRVAVVDVGWRGTTQEAFQWALKSLLDLEVFGYYFCLADTVECRQRAEQQHMAALLTADNTAARTLDTVYRNRVAIELFFSAPHASVIGWQIGAAGVEPVLDPGRGSAHHLSDCAEGIVRGIEAYAAHHVAEHQRLGLSLGPQQLAWPLVELALGQHEAARQRIDSLKNFDTWSSSRHHQMGLNDYQA